MPTAAPEIERLVQLLAKLPGLGPRSARRAALHLLKRKDEALVPLATALAAAAERVRACSICHALDVVDPCRICADDARDRGLVCVVQDVADVWALERAGAHRGRYHVLGGVLSAIDGVRPGDLAIDSLVTRARTEELREVILALDATVDGAATTHFLTDRLRACGVEVTAIARGVPVGGALEYLDDGTLAAALQSRRPS